MNGELTAIRDYLRPPPDSFWKWTEDGEAIVWRDGRTIAFRQEVEAVLSRLQSRGLPPFGSIVMLLAACRNSWPKTKEQFAVLQGTTWDWIHNFPDQLDRIYNLPATLRSHPPAKAELAAMIFESSAWLSPPRLATSVLKALANGMAAELLAIEANDPITVREFVRDLQPLIAGIHFVDADALRLRLETSLEQDVLPAEADDSPPATLVRQLLEQLRDDEELAGMVRLARNLLAVVSLPRPLADRDEMPIGGVSDISNRGTLDRLLISELAQDDDTLMMRVAMREALYLRRETPPRNPPRSRRIIIDSGLRLWGVPRVFATSIALSLTAMSDPDGRLDVFRPEGEELQPVDLTTRDGLIEHLKALCPDIHPGTALVSLPEAEEPDTDTILITAEDVANDPDFQRDLSSLSVAIPFLMTISRDGKLQVIERTSFGSKRIREATLSLEELLAPTEKPRLPLVDEKLKRSEDLPAIWRVKPFPLRLSHHVKPENTWMVRGHGALSITNDWRLMHWDHRAQGARQLADYLPSRQLHWCSRSAEYGITHCVIGDRGQPKLWFVTIDIKNAVVSTTLLPTRQTFVRGVCEYAGVLFVIYRNFVNGHDSRTGECIAMKELPWAMKWLHDRYFFHQSQYQALAFDGDQIQIETISTVEKLNRAIPKTLYSNCGKIFDVDEATGPMGILQDGTLFRFADEKVILLKNRLPRRLWMYRVARDGKRILVRDSHSFQHYVIQTETGEVTRCGSDLGFLLEPEVRNMITRRNVRKRFVAVSLLYDDFEARRLLLLRNSKGQDFAIGIPTVSPEKFYLFRSEHKAITRCPIQPFQPHDTPRDVRIRLQSASFPDGSQVFLDSRGLLHLRSSDRNIPEVTFVLGDGELAGWSSDGRKWGPNYHLGAYPKSDPAIIFNEILQPFVKRIVG